MIKCEIIIDGKLYRVTNDLVNWDDVQLSIKRADYDGVSRSFSSKFEFTNGAYTILKRQYHTNYLKAAASLIISRRNNSWTWNEVFRCTLDFSTYEDTGRNISINAVDDSLAAIIKAKKGTQYEYPVVEIKEEEPLAYDGLEIVNEVKWIAVGESNDENSDVSVQIKDGGFRTIPLYIQSSEIMYNDSLECSDMEQELASPSRGFIVATKKTTIKISLDFYFKSDSRLDTRVVLMKNGVGLPEAKWTQRAGADFAHCKAELLLEAKPKDAFTLYVTSNIGSFDGGYSVVFKDVKISCNWAGRMQGSVDIDLISPSNLLNSLLSSMNGGKEGVSGYIDHSERVDICKIVAAESIRAIPDAKLYSSFGKFADWMKSVFGYVYEISDNTITFKHRSKFFSNTIIKEIIEFNDFSHSVNQSLIYSTIRTGYNKQEYDSINGRDEFRFTNTYSTGLTLTENTLDLISPYRADAYGIEFLVQERGKDTTDTKSDNDLFFVGVKKDLAKYKLLRKSDGYDISGVMNADTMFNSMYSPRSILIANRQIIGACSNVVTFDSSEGNSDVYINGESETSELSIPESDRLFTVGKLSFKASEFDIPEEKNGLIVLEKNGDRYFGYNLKTDINIGKEESVNYSLAIKRIE